jgi:hypothetical protein
VASLGYSTVKTNLYTVAPNIVGTLAVLALTFSSDHFRERSIHMWVLIEYLKHSYEQRNRCIPLATAVIGFIVLGSINPLQQRGVAYFACFLLTIGVGST